MSETKKFKKLTKKFGSLKYLSIFVINNKKISSLKD